MGGLKRSKVPSLLLRSTKVPKLSSDSSVCSAKAEESSDAAAVAPVVAKTATAPVIRRTQAKKFTPPARKLVATTSTSTSQDKTPSGDTLIVFEVYWTKRSNKKHKTYADGILVIRNRVCSLRDTEGKEIGKTTSYSLSTLNDLKEGNTLEVGAKEIEIVKPIPKEEYTSGRIFVAEVKPTKVKTTVTKKPPVNIRSVRSVKRETQAPKPLFDPNAEGAVVLYKAEGVYDANGDQHCSVVIDPHLGKKLRPHQIEGVQFLFDCCVGLRNEGWNGCILADAMGLGKTLQAITLLHTLLHQNPLGGKTIRKALIVCPSSLVDNWKKELNRWLGVRIKPLCIGGDSNKKIITETLAQFKTLGAKNQNNVLIISYGYFKRNVKALQSTAADLILCDEGHKLKNGSSQITKALNSMPTKRRVILSGTPIQNDLQEFYYIMDVVNPGIMGTLNAFKRTFEKPILLSSEKNCSARAQEEGEARVKELSNRCNLFILRRNANILIPYLPPKVEQVLFCRLSDVQVRLYKYLTSSGVLDQAKENNAFAFGCIQLMEKLCNHPALVYEKCRNDYPDAIPLFGEDFDPKLCQAKFSGKIQAVDRLLQVVRESGKDNKVVLVSNYTKTLDLLEKLCKQRTYTFLRLDGSTESSKRMKLVDRFNNKHSPEFIFLLSSKAGGVGLNLIGGNRLILLDPDWNPATDEQAMARIWREGQPKPVWIYRMISTGTIEEKVYQRQMRKQALSRSIVDDSISEKKNFTNKELRELFKLNIQTRSNTHDLIGCDCVGHANTETSDQGFGVSFSADDGWTHFNSTESCSDPAVAKINNQLSSSIYPDDDLISFIFAHKTKDVSEVPCVEEVAHDSPKKYLGYDSDDFVSPNTAKKKKKSPKPNLIEGKDPEEEEEEVLSGAESQEDESEEIVLASRPKRLQRTKVTADVLLDDNDEDMEDLLALEFSSDEE